MKAMEANHYMLQMKTMKATMTMLATKAMEAMNRKEAMKAMRALQAMKAMTETVGIREKGDDRLALLTLLALLSLNASQHGRDNCVMMQLPPRPAVGLQRPPSWSGGWPC